MEREIIEIIENGINDKNNYSIQSKRIKIRKHRICDIKITMKLLSKFQILMRIIYLQHKKCLKESIHRLH